MSQDPSLSRLSALLSIDLLHGADYQTEEQEIHLRVLLQLQGHSSFDKSSKNCCLAAATNRFKSLRKISRPLVQSRCPWGSSPWCWCCSCPSSRSPPSPASRRHLPSDSMMSTKWNIVDDNGHLKNDKMTPKGGLNPEGRILQLKGIAIFKVDRGIVQENSKRGFHHRAGLLHSGEHHHLRLSGNV